MNNKNKFIFILSFSFIFFSLYPKYFKYKYIKVAYYSVSIRYGGIERVFSVLINYLSKEKYFIFYLITKTGKLKGDYPISNAKRISLYERNISLYKALEKENIDILIYN